MAVAGRRKALLAWECGSGFGHTTQLAMIGAGLMRHGVDVVATSTRPAFDAPFHKAGIRVIAGPLWPPLRLDAFPGAPATLSYGLLQQGLGDSAAVRNILEGWGRILDAERPGFVVCNYAPLAGVAARQRARVMRTGAAYFTPPAHLTFTPPLFRTPEPQSGDVELLASVNAACLALGAPPLAHIGALAGGDDCFLSTLPLLDPYAEHRQVQAEGPFLAAPIEPRQPDARGVFAYLHERTWISADVVDALCGLGGALDAYLPLAPADVTSKLRQAGAHLHDGPVPLAHVLPRRRLLLHNGGAGIAADAILAGTPQFTLPFHIEHYVNGLIIAAAGLGPTMPVFFREPKLTTAALRATMADDDLALVAAAAAIHHAPLLDPDPLERMLARCLALL